jgi:hypothetical protein
VAAAALFALAGCASGSDPATTVGPSQAISVEPEDPALAAYYGQNLVWTGCGGKFECATMSVPLTYDEPDGESIDVKLIRLPAGNPDERLGSLVLNPGGPGGPGSSTPVQRASWSPGISSTTTTSWASTPAGWPTARPSSASPTGSSTGS